MSKHFKVFITPSAKNDIIDIANFIAADNPAAGVKISSIFRNAFEMLSEFPNVGISKKEIKDKTVKIYITNKRFLIAYRIKENHIEILRVLTKYQDVFAIL